MSASLGRVVQVGAGIALVVATVAWLSGSCGEKIEPGSAPPATSSDTADSTTVAVERTLEAVVEAVSGTVVSARHTTVSAKILARIEDVKVRAGSESGAGDVLVVLDSRDLAAQAREAEESARGPRVRSSNSPDASATASQELFAQGVAARRDLDRALSAFQVAAAEAERAEQHVRDAEVAHSHGEIRLPVAGRVVRSARRARRHRIARCAAVAHLRPQRAAPRSGCARVARPASVGGTARLRLHRSHLRAQRRRDRRDRAANRDGRRAPSS